MIDERQKQYAILSHTWGEEEVSFQDLRQDRGPGMKGYWKIQQTCRQALEDGNAYAWVDTCCINKDIDAELGEAIRSMYRWYHRAERRGAPEIPGENPLYRQGRVWKRNARPLQSEPLVYSRLDPPRTHRPEKHEVFGAGWTDLGTKADLHFEIAETTGIDTLVLQRGILKTSSVATKMSWAGDRKTTRVEDRAYCLIGLFDVDMALLYGEGEKAFQRLQEEIIATTIDHSIFCWTPRPGEHSNDLLASSPAQFKKDIHQREGPQYMGSYRLGNAGLEMRLRVVQRDGHRAEGSIYGVLGCYSSPGLAVVLSLKPAALLLTPDRFGSSRFTSNVARSGEHLEFLWLDKATTVATSEILILRHALDDDLVTWRPGRLREPAWACGYVVVICLSQSLARTMVAPITSWGEFAGLHNCFLPFTPHGYIIWKSVSAHTEPDRVGLAIGMEAGTMGLLMHLFCPSSIEWWDDSKADDEHFQRDVARRILGDKGTTLRTWLEVDSDTVVEASAARDFVHGRTVYAVTVEVHQHDNIQ
ncbi:uncharacterized protein LTR77_010801 [Saxophila tyrrhenica]|uniref:Heterokaryon incompatibility domain-containing protein n=1 Tax=Saxophila tyrrhenica TaxID=1690608 RepID=A0AAV9NXM3_9PEZI|nr:hypothetical protein LTR77_010801 [Saxophila tyrrhenica]